MRGALGWGSREVAGVSAPTSAFTLGTQVGVPTGTSLTPTSGLPAADATESLTITHPISGASALLTGVSVWRRRKWTATITPTPAGGATYLFDECEFEVGSDNWCVEVGEANGTLDQMLPLAVFRRCTFNGLDTTGRALLGPFTWLLDCHLGNAEDGWQGAIYSVGIGSNILPTTDGQADPHQDGVQITGLGHLTLYRCWIDADVAGATSAVRLGTEFSAVANVHVHYCGMTGGSYTMQSRGDAGAGDITGVSVVGCRLAGSAPNGTAVNGPTDFVETTVSAWSDNKFIGDGSTISNPAP